MVIDDCRLTMQIARDILEADGFEVATAETTLEANSLIFCNNPPALILIDVEMPLFDGEQTTKLLKAPAQQGHRDLNDFSQVPGRFVFNCQSIQCGRRHMQAFVA